MKPLCCALSLLALGLCLGDWHGAPTPGNIALLTAALAFLPIAVCARPGPGVDVRARKLLPAVLIGIVVIFAVMLATTQMLQGLILSRLAINLWLLFSGIMVAFTFRRGVPTVARCRARVLPVVMAGFLLLGVRSIRKDPAPPIDVYVMQQTAVRAMSQFGNPYTATYPDIYGPDSPYYIPLARNGRTLYGLNYPPLLGILNLPSFLLTGDVRYGYLAALLLACGLIATMQESWLALCGAVLLLVNPFSLMMIEFAWVEPMVILLFCLTLFALLRYRKAVPWLFGLFLCAKQTDFAILPLGWMLMDAPWEWKEAAVFFGKAIAVVAAMVLPYYFWNPGAFVLSTFTLQVRVPLRPDLISYPDFAATHGWGILPVWLPFLWLPIGAWLGWSKASRTPDGFAAAAALMLIAFFALSKQGAPNYYFLELGMLCCSLAVRPGPAELEQVWERRGLRALAAEVAP